MKEVILGCLFMTSFTLGCVDVQAQSTGDTELETTYELFDEDCRYKIGVRIQDYVKHTPTADKGFAYVRRSSQERKVLRVARELRGKREQTRVCTRKTLGTLGLAEVSAYYLDKNRSGAFEAGRDALFGNKIECLYPSGDVLATYIQIDDGEIYCARTR